jgi:hypothetical protein
MTAVAQEPATRIVRALQSPAITRGRSAAIQMGGGAMEFLLVKFPQTRDVLADGDEIGETNTTLMLPAGEYTITLSGDGYAPDEQDVVLAGTSSNNPKVVTFTQVAVPAPIMPAATPGIVAPSASTAKPKAKPKATPAVRKAAAKANPRTKPKAKKKANSKSSARGTSGARKARKTARKSR